MRVGDKVASFADSVQASWHSESSVHSRLLEPVLSSPRHRSPAEPFQLVLLGTVMELSILLFEIPTGIVADLYSRKWSVAISFVVVGAAYALSANADVYWLLVLSQIMVGFGSTFVTGAETAWITDELGSAEEAEPLILRRAGYQR